jgi:hypothetical protein
LGPKRIFEIDEPKLQADCIPMKNITNSTPSNRRAQMLVLVANFSGFSVGNS